MKRYTAKSLAGTWGNDKSAHARAKRGRWSSGPNEDELKVFDRLFKKAVEGKKDHKTLVLGATTELRDLAIENGSETLAVDLSQKLLCLFHDAMKHKDSDKNCYMKCDWFKIDQFLIPESFDVIFADCSLNNIIPEDNEVMMRIVSKMLKKGGYFIQRNFVFRPEKKQRKVKDFVREYNENKNTPLGLFLEMGLYSSLADKALNKEMKELLWWKISDDIVNLVEKDIPEKEMDYIRNMAEHARIHSSIIFLKEEFEGILKKFFKIEEVVMLKKYVYTDGAPIYFLKKI